MIKTAKVNITMTPTVKAAPVRRRGAKVNIDIHTSQSVGTKPVKLVIKGKHFKRVLDLLTLYEKPDEELAETVRGSILADEVKGKTIEEAATWVRKNITDELSEMGGEG